MPGSKSNASIMTAEQIEAAEMEEVRHNVDDESTPCDKLLENDSVNVTGQICVQNGLNARNGSVSDSNPTSSFIYTRAAPEKHQLLASETDKGSIFSPGNKFQHNHKLSIELISTRTTMTETPLPQKPTVPDGGWGWIIVFCSTCITAIVGMSYVAFSFCYVEFVAAFDTSTAVAGWIGSIYMATGSLLGIFFSVAVHEYGSRPVCVLGTIIACLGYVASSFASSVVFLYVSFGLVAGSGNGMIVLSTLVITQLYFDKRRALASGIAVAGFSLGTLVGGPLSQFLLDSYTWRGTLLIIGAIYLQISVFGLLFRPLQPQTNKVTRPTGAGITPKSRDGDCHPNIIPEQKLITTSNLAMDCEKNGRLSVSLPVGEVHITGPSRNRTHVCCTRFGAQIREAFDFSLLLDMPYSLYVAGQCLSHFGTMTFYQHTPSRAVHLGIDRHLVSRLPIFTGVATGVSRVVLSFVANAPCTDRVLQYGISTCMVAVVQMTTFLATNFVTLAVYGVVQGTINGAYFCIMTTILVDLKGVQHIVRAQSIISLAIGCSMLVATPFSGFLFDTTRNYDIPFLVTGAMQLVGGMLGITCAILRRVRERRRLQEKQKTAEACTTSANNMELQAATAVYESEKQQIDP